MRAVRATSDPYLMGGDAGDQLAILGSGYLAERERWLVRLRWLAILGVLTVVTLATALGWVESPPALYAAAGGMIAYNIVFWREREIHVRAKGEIDSRERLIIALQVFCDLSALTILLHWSGGMENPFSILFVFHMAIAAMLLPLWHALVLGCASALLFGGTVIAEFLGLVPHHPVLLGAAGGGARSPAAWQSAPLVTGFLIAFTFGLFGVIYFVRSVERQRRTAQRVAHERERVAEAQEHMARIGAISAGVSHSVRNPLHGLMNCVDLLRSKNNESAGADVEILELMTEGLNRIENVTRRLLTFTRDQKLDRRLTNINTLIEDAVRFTFSHSDQPAPSLSLGDVPHVHVDAERMSESVINLLDNALRACRDGGAISVHTEWRATTEDVCIRISDSGEGIAEEGLANIFDPFYTTQSQGEGSGLGLAIVRSVVEEHGGEIRAESSPGVGTTFRIHLPVTMLTSSRGRRE